MAFTSIPPYFSWLVDRLLAISAHPYHHTQLKYLTENGINNIVSINDETTPPFHTRPNLKVFYFSIPGDTPTLQQCQQFVSIIENAKQRRDGVLVHSLKSTGRAAVLALCYLIKAWECPVDYAIDRMRLTRPISIENSDQENMVKQYHALIADNFEGYYARIQTKWDPKTEFLGKGDITNSFVDQPVNELFTNRIQNQYQITNYKHQYLREYVVVEKL